ncbi:hypothetical protein Syun_030499 [Stephania yunnanensis]|uniref:Exopolygalacturonase n=1 Tax=Stephania yunnanensis TaxID=152371 RepID=A0AAP0E7E9_9MAGN
MQGTLLGSDLSNFGTSGDWVQFGWLDGLTLTGGGTFDGQGAKAWPFNKCPTKKNCQVLPANLRFVNMNRTRVDGIKSVNSKFFHMILQGCSNFQGRRIRITAPDESPNTDGIHIEESNDVTIAQTVVGTGDDCISIGQGNTGITLSGITCGPGHGISVGSLGRYPDEADVKGLIVKDSTLTGTMNGVRIKTWENSPAATTASNMTFQNIVMKNVGNPIIIDQTYCPYVSCSSQSPSRVKISDISFKNIRGTTTSPVAVTLDCSKGIPCQGINLENVQLTLVDQKTSLRGKKPSATAFCQNVKAKYSGPQFPPPCN